MNCISDISLHFPDSCLILPTTCLGYPLWPWFVGWCLYFLRPLGRDCSSFSGARSCPLPVVLTHVATGRQLVLEDGVMGWDPVPPGDKIQHRITKHFLWWTGTPKLEVFALLVLLFVFLPHWLSYEKAVPEAYCLLHLCLLSLIGKRKRNTVFNFMSNWSYARRKWITST